jgi:hypothetical protein
MKGHSPVQEVGFKTYHKGLQKPTSLAEFEPASIRGTARFWKWGSKLTTRATKVDQFSSLQLALVFVNLPKKY